ncbi:MAG: hypothetical protein FWF96_08360, partial [Kiritimatiellaeota bacterium]|nr:hypothetical protein [Kiritimatiellota bacterium]
CAKSGCPFRAFFIRNLVAVARAHAKIMECGDSSPFFVRESRASNDETKAAMNRRTPYVLAIVGCVLLAVALRVDAQIVPDPGSRPSLSTQTRPPIVPLSPERQAELREAARRKADMEATRYEVVPGIREGAPPTLYAINQNTGEVAQRRGNEWVSIVKKLDWDSIRTLDEVQQEERENQDKAQEAWDTEEAARKAKNEALQNDFLKAIPQTPLAELVAMADEISLLYQGQTDTYWTEERWQGIQVSDAITNENSLRYFDNGRVYIIAWLKPDEQFLRLERTTSGAPINWPKMKDGDFFVKFEAPVKGWVAPTSPFRTASKPMPIIRQRITPSPGAMPTPGVIRPSNSEGKITFYLSHTSPDNKTIFPAPETIVDDVKAEIQRQAEEQ